MQWLRKILATSASGQPPERLFVHHHLGLGDTFTSCAIVRQLAGIVGTGGVRVFAKECNAGNVRFLYRDDPRIQVVPLPIARDAPIGEHELVKAFVRAHRARPSECVTIGFSRMHRLHRRFGQGISCDECFYVQAGLPYDLRFSGFHLQRDLPLEEDAYRRFNPSGEPYAFVDADPSRGMHIPTLDAAHGAGAETGLRRLFNDPAIPLMHMGLILERARELHLCESSIRCMVEGSAVFRLGARALFLHTFRGSIWGHNTALPWIQIGPQGEPLGRCVPFGEASAQRRLLGEATDWARARWSADALQQVLFHRLKEPNP